MIVCAGISFAQRTITGTVTDTNGEPLIGASVLAQGTTVGTVTDFDGSYTIKVPDGSGMLIYSYTGFGTKEVPLGASNVMDVTMEEGVTLAAAVVTALGVERSEKAVGYAVQEVDGDEIVQTGATSTIDALRGQAAGVNVVRSSGSAGGGSRVVVRGQTSLTGNNQALIVVDGVRINNSTFYSEGASGASPTGGSVAGSAASNRGMDINPADIESINVLKGAAATALYGVDGANGVIVITTKSGSRARGKGFSVSAGVQYGVSEITNMPDLQSTFAQGSGGVYRGPETGNSGSWGPRISDLSYDGATDWPYDPNGRIVAADSSAANGQPVNAYDPINDFFQMGSQFQTNLAISGGNERANFRFSTSTLDELGIIPNNEYDRNTFKLAGDLTLTDKLTVSASANYIRSEGIRVQQGSNTSGLLLGLLRTPPTFDNSNGLSDPVNNEASYVLPAEFGGGQRNYRGGGGYDNPYWTTNRTLGFDDVNRFFGNLKVNYNLHTWANLSINLGADQYSDNRRQEFEIGSRTAPSGRIIEDQYFFRNYDTYFNLSGTGNLTDALQMNYLVGVNINGERLNRSYIEGNTLAFPGFVHVTNASEVSSDNDERNIDNVGFYGNLDFAYNGWLYLSATARQDYVSTLIVPGAFDAGAISFLYPSVNAGIVFTELMDNDDVLSFGKIRASYAEVGGGAPNPYGTTTPFLLASADDGWADGLLWPFMGQSGFRLSNQLGNPTLRPERTKTWEFGADLRFFQGRLGLDATYYTSESIDQIVPVDLPGSTGYTAALLNAGLISSRGVELILNASPVRSRAFSWDVQVNFDHNNSIVETLVDLDDDGESDIETLQIGGFTGTGIYHVVGAEYGQIFGGAYLRSGAGTDADNGVNIPGGAIVINDAGDEETNSEFGFQIPDQTLRIIGNPNPDFTMGINNTFTFGDISLSVLLDWKQGGQMWNGTAWALSFFGRSQATADTRVEAPFAIEGVKQSDGSPNDIQIVRGQNYWGGSSVGGFGSVDEQFVQDTDWFRIRALTLSYNLNPKWFEGTFIEGGSVYFNGRNLLLVTPYEGVDPETSLQGTGNAQGFDYFNMPATRNYNFGLNLNF